MTHVYTLIVKPDNTYIVKIDNEKVESGSLEEDWDFLLPKEIEDPTEKKPIEWDDKEQIDDPEDVKPEDWDLEAEHVVDPAATKPDDWDDEMDGEWEAPMIDNTKFKVCNTFYTKLTTQIISALNYNYLINKLSL